MVILLFRTVVLYITIIVALRLMGKRQIGELQPNELVIAITISDLAAIPMQNSGIPLINGIIPIITLIALEILVSYVTLHCRKLRAFVVGHPMVLIDNGQINAEGLHKTRCSLDDLVEVLRNSGYPNISDVAYAVLETNGQVSVLPKNQKAPLTPSDMKLKTPPDKLPLCLIMDGKPIAQSLKEANLSEVWLEKELKMRGIPSIKSTLFASIDAEGVLYAQGKEDMK